MEPRDPAGWMPSRQRVLDGVQVWGHREQPSKATGWSFHRGQAGLGEAEVWGDRGNGGLHLGAHWPSGPGPKDS